MTPGTVTFLPAAPELSHCLTLACAFARYGASVAPALAIAWSAVSLGDLSTHNPPAGCPAGAGAFASDTLAVPAGAAADCVDAVAAEAGTTVPTRAAMAMAGTRSRTKLILR